LSELAYLPLPANLSKTIGADPRRASVADFLSVALAAPSTLEQHPDAEAVLVFAASRVVAVDGAEFLAPRSILARPTQWDQLTFGHRLNMPGAEPAGRGAELRPSPWRRCSSLALT
jgi:hypothetical protein